MDEVSDDEPMALEEREAALTEETTAPDEDAPRLHPGPPTSTGARWRS